MGICRLPRGGCVRAHDRGDDPAVLLIGFCQTPRQTELRPPKRRKPRPRLRHHLEDMIIMRATIKPGVKFGIVSRIFFLRA